MARKRMIDPGIWLSEDFSNLSILARLVWIGIISNADDEGRGKANISYLKSQLFPYDDELSLKKIENSLKEIEKNMSIVFYEIENKKYFQLTSWHKFQKIDKPSPSSIPKKPENSCDSDSFVLEQSAKNLQVFDECSANTPRILDEQLAPKREREIEYNNKYNIRENKKRKFEIFLSQNFPKITLNPVDFDASEFDFEKLKKAIKESSFLQGSTLSFIFNNYNKVVNDEYKDFNKQTRQQEFSQRSYTNKEVTGVFDNLDDLDI